MLLKAVLILLIILITLQANKHATRWIKKLALAKGASVDRTFNLQKTFQFFIFCIAISVSLVTLGIGYSELDLFLSSVFAVIGIALFAQWSILSNITASVMIFFFFPYKVGQHIALMDKDKEKIIRGKLVEISIFYILLELESGEKMTYPTTLVFQNPIAYKKAEKDDDITQ